MDYFKVTKRCIRCLKPLRENDGTCQNPKCVRYKPEEVLTQEMPSEGTATPTQDNTTTPATDSQPSDEYEEIVGEPYVPENAEEK